MDINAAFQWKCYPEAEKLLQQTLDEVIKKNPNVETLSNELLKHTSTRLFDWLDHMIVGYTSELIEKLNEVGFVSETVSPTYRVYHHPRAQFPRVVVHDRSTTIGIGVSVESIENFLMVRGLSSAIFGSSFSGYRCCLVNDENGVELWIVERRGALGIEPTYISDTQICNYLLAKEEWKKRPRTLLQEEEDLEFSIILAQEIVDLVGQELAAWAILDCEREYWQSRNSAAQIQKNRQDRLGMGWANHDHHTFRSSRKHFIKLVRLFEVLGFHCRERFYAGEEAGWGAQVMENPRCRLVLFLDVDLHAKEIEIDFAHQPLPEIDRLGTIGLWCALHGDSIVKSGMHHLEAQFMFDELAHDLKGHGVTMMDPFSFFPYLKQAFTHGEIWQVDHGRLDELLSSGKITQTQFDKFSSYGAIGSHMENLQRREGYKGFNQKNVSIIIKKTDPRG